MAEEPPGTGNRSATRYLSAGAYLDPVFRTRAVQTVLDQEHTAVAPSYSIDIVPILRHSLAAARLQRSTDQLVAAVVGLCLVISFRQIVVLVCLVYGLLAMLRALYGVTRRNPISATLYFLLGLILLFAANNTGNSLLSDTEVYGSEAVSGGFGRLLATALLALFGAAAALAWQQLTIHQTLLNSFTQDGFRPEAAPAPPAKFRDRLAYLGRAQHGNVTIYSQSRRHNPFLGCGPVTEAWSLALPLVPDPDQEHAPERLTVDGLYRSMRKALVSLADPRDDEELRIKGLALQQRIFAAGLLPRDHPLLDEHRQPRLSISQAEIEQLSQDERSRSTQLLTVRVNGWDGELDVTVLLYFSVRGNMLYTEFTACSLPPIAAQYHQIDTLTQLSPSVGLRAALVGLLGAPRALIRCPLDVVMPVVTSLRRNLDVRGQVQKISSQLSFDYGAAESVRELGADTDVENLFHQFDSQRYIKIVNRRVIEAITEVLAENGYSNEDFVQRTNVYMDQSMHIRDSTLTNVPIAHGTGSRADNRSSGPPAPTARTGAPR